MTACDVGKWGINCKNDCSNRCVNLSCDFKTGQCKQGCDEYSGPPYCTQEGPLSQSGSSQQHVYDRPCSTTINIHAYGAVQSDIETKAPTAMEASNYCNLLVNTECGKIYYQTE
ncbi:hypothetical protein Btru_053961 [Bulinus truncatus]|nr:hypothetical protein Btru_053961 [Bulinus truncatus]